MGLKYALPLGLVFLGLMRVSAVFALDCAQCGEDYEHLRHARAQREKTIHLLAENKRYLASVSASEASKFLKVNSNVTMILKKLESIQAVTERSQERLTQNGCSECQLPLALAGEKGNEGAHREE